MNFSNKTLMSLIVLLAYGPAIMAQQTQEQKAIEQSKPNYIKVGLYGGSALLSVELFLFTIKRTHDFIKFSKEWKTADITNKCINLGQRAAVASILSYIFVKSAQEAQLQLNQKSVNNQEQ